MKSAVVFLAEGFEEVEAVTPIDFLRRAGVKVVTAGIGSKLVRGAHGIQIEADIELSAIGSINPESFDALVFPGGMPGAENIASEAVILEMIESFNAGNKVIAAICAAPAVVLSKTTVMNGRRATCYPGFEKMFSTDTLFSEERVVQDGNLITSRGPGTAAEFALKLVAVLADKESAEDLRKGTIQPR